jgi:hypothetical protein
MSEVTATSEPDPFADDSDESLRAAYASLQRRMEAIAAEMERRGGHPIVTDHQK